MSVVEAHIVYVSTAPLSSKTSIAGNPDSFKNTSHVDKLPAMRFNVKYNMILFVNIACILFSLACLYNEILVIRIASAPFVMISVLTTVWLVQHMAAIQPRKFRSLDEEQKHDKV